MPYRCSIIDHSGRSAKVTAKVIGIPSRTIATVIAKSVPDVTHLVWKTRWQSSGMTIGWIDGSR